MVGLASPLPRLARPAAPASCAYFEPQTGDGGAFTRGRGAQLVLCSISEQPKRTMRHKRDYQKSRQGTERPLPASLFRSRSLKISRPDDVNHVVG